MCYFFVVLVDVFHVLTLLRSGILAGSSGGGSSRSSSSNKELSSAHTDAIEDRCNRSQCPCSSLSFTLISYLFSLSCSALLSYLSLTLLSSLLSISYYPFSCSALLSFLSVAAAGQLKTMCGRIQRQVHMFTLAVIVTALIAIVVVTIEVRNCVQANSNYHDALVEKIQSILDIMIADDTTNCKDHSSI